MNPTDAILDRFGIGADDPRRAQLAGYRRWLREEALVAGGLGPGEGGRLDQRHLAESLAMAEVWWPSVPTTLLDVGSGVGLPGIPLAILHPQTSVTLLDRSGRRAGLLRRAIRVIALEGIEVVQQDLEEFEGRFEVVTARAVADPGRLRPHLDRLTSARGWGIVAGSRIEAPTFAGYESRLVGAGILDPPSWILIMAGTSRRTSS